MKIKKFLFMALCIMASAVQAIEADQSLKNNDGVVVQSRMVTRYYVKTERDVDSQGNAVVRNNLVPYETGVKLIRTGDSCKLVAISASSSENMQTASPLLKQVEHEMPCNSTIDDLPQ